MAFQQNKEINSLIDDLSNCQICFNPFGSKECCPRMLSCGHTFCHSCLQRFISERSVCPTCQKDFNFISADDIQINFSVKSFSENLTKTKDPTKVMADTQEAASSTDSIEFLAEKKTNKTKELPYEAHCEEHCIPNYLKCLDCNKYVCGICVAMVHKSCTSVLPILDALNFMKSDMLKKIKVFTTNLEKEETMLNSKLDLLTRKQEKLHQKIEIVETEVKETKSKIERNQKLHQESTGYEDNLEKATSNQDYDKVDSKVKFFLNENCMNISLPTAPFVLPIEDALKLTRKDLEENTFYVMKKNDKEERKYAKMKIEDHQISFDEWGDEVEEGASCVDFLDFITSRSAVIDTQKFVEEHKKELHNPKIPVVRFKCSKIEVMEREVYFNFFKPTDGIEFGFEFGGLLKTLECCSVVPAEAFLKIQNLKKEVVITTDGQSPRALNFLLVASGIMEDSYVKTGFSDYTGFCDYGSVVNGGGKYRINGYSRCLEFNCFSGIVEGIQDGGMYQKIIERGDVGGGDASDQNKLSLFCVCRKDSFNYSNKTFGRVTRGMEVVDQIIGGRNGDLVIECGLHFNLPLSSGFQSETLHNKIFFY